MPVPGLRLDSTGRLAAPGYEVWHVDEVGHPGRLGTRNELLLDEKERCTLVVEGLCDGTGLKGEVAKTLYAYGVVLSIYGVFLSAQE